ncbi:MAG: TlpA family protein disulfide reductase [Deltaproteobacteria bacterium]|nr:TlpA family protein disulfide reductase [Deltaproteobacteria bacterium]
MFIRALSVLLGLFLLPLSAGAKPLEVGKRAPDFYLRDQSQALIHLADVTSGHVVVLDFFRTDCAPCKKSLAALKKVHQATKGKKVRVMILALLEEEEGEEKLARFFKQNPMPFQILVDAYGVVAKKYIRKGNSMQLPSLFVIDRKNRVRFRHNSLLSDPKELMATLDKVL